MLASLSCVLVLFPFNVVVLSSVYYCIHIPINSNWLDFVCSGLLSKSRQFALYRAGYQTEYFAPKDSPGLPCWLSVITSISFFFFLQMDNLWTDIWLTLMCFTFIWCFRVGLLYSNFCILWCEYDISLENSPGKSEVRWTLSQADSLKICRWKLFSYLVLIIIFLFFEIFAILHIYFIY